MSSIQRKYPTTITTTSRNPSFVASPRWRLSVLGFFPSLLISSSFSQPGFPFLFNFVGQMASFFSVGAAGILVYSAFRRGNLVLLIVGGVLMTKVARIFIGIENSYVLLSYILFSGTLFLLAGAVVALHESKLLYRQVMFFCLISIPLMILQLAGIGEWTMIFQLEYYGSTRAQVFVSTLFQSISDNLYWQYRPAGFLYTNVFLVAVLLVALGLHFGRIGKQSYFLNDLVICAIIVFTMAKTSFLAFGLLSMWFLIAGNRQERKRVFVMLSLFCIFMACYAILFPSAFKYNTSWGLIKLNFFMRWYALKARMKGYTLQELQIDDENYGGVYKLGDDPQSGYGTIGKALPYLVVLVFLLAPLYLKQFYKLKRYFPELKEQTKVFLILAFISPISASFTGANISWFTMGFGFLPLILFLKPFVLEKRLREHEPPASR